MRTPPDEGHALPGRELDELRAENARLRRLLEISEHESRAAREAQPELALHADGPVTSRSPAETKVAFYQSLFRARTDIYALRWENTKAGSSGGCPPSPEAGASGWTGRTPTTCV